MIDRAARWEIVKACDLLRVEQFGDALIIKDVGPWETYKTVTNDAANVVARLLLSGTLKPGQRLLCYDSGGNLDELLIKDGKFVDFGFLPGANSVAR